ncbi:MAG: peptidoglycan editing factor PgeF [Candidatus Marinimicrobia bacterium]|nr:peptidoglycan editing factor PgeF [Candidatus Neomarinimicrobiota bacterium]MCH7762950.1 peptidoglycan editing factor PgeF [Candidatus Neomarinimicrobiota bacterium]
MRIPKDSFLELSHHFRSNGFKAGLTLRSFPYSTPDDRIRFAEELLLDSSALVIPKQVHGNTVCNCHKNGRIENVDALISNNRDIVLSIQVADCIPLFLLDINANICALVHAGWRGTGKKIVTNTIQEMVKIGSRIKDIKALMGPSIQQCCFEIGPEVAEKFPEVFLTKGGSDRSYLDLQGVLQSELIDLGMKEKQIILLSECTSCCGGMFHSYRKNGKKAGRMIAMCGWV